MQKESAKSDMKKTINKDNVVKIYMFGEFRIVIGDCVIQDSAARTHQLWHLIEYLIAFRNKTISQEELIDILWPDATIENPANALKNLVYRARSSFSTYDLPYAKEMITYNRGSYQWNKELDCTVDTEVFEALCQKADNVSRTLEYRIDKYMQAIQIYKGDFLPGACYEAWVVPINSYYRSLYFKCVYAVLELLESAERYGDIEMICKKSLIIDQFEERAHKYLIHSLIKQGKQTQAMAHYSFMTDLFFRELGVNPSASMRALYRDIVKTVHNVEIDINIVKDDLKEADQSDGAFFCEYEVFKNLYRLEARTAARTGQSIYISLITLASETEDEVIEVKAQTKAMDGLYTIVENSLRKGDVFSRFSATQYVLMLPTLTFENCAMVMDRIVKKFKQSYRIKGIRVSAKVQPLDPVQALL